MSLGEMALRLKAIDYQRTERGMMTLVRSVLDANPSSTATTPTVSCSTVHGG